MSQSSDDEVHRASTSCAFAVSSSDLISKFAIFVLETQKKANNPLKDYSPVLGLSYRFI